MNERGTYRKPKECLGSGDYERLPEGSLHLSSQQVEVLSRSSREHYVHVDIDILIQTLCIIRELYILIFLSNFALQFVALWIAKLWMWLLT